MEDLGAYRRAVRKCMILEPNGAALVADASDVLVALTTTRALSDPEFAHTVLRHYIERKLHRKRTREQVGAKLQRIESKVPQFAADFHAIRDTYALGPSDVLPSLVAAPCRAGGEMHAPPAYSSDRLPVYTAAA
ncbi:uncharacterized protein LOC62_05G007631 [Vanrija pseudolonga]|uniref:Uncharacterized protein n=1 Tax=Vanrija pseudolonga TaxID=143232 RepID=A0AAF0YFM4_9TREE|nr:hypothetical protein LOC62_05G007631 [Vanrija pseudolonga]